MVKDKKNTTRKLIGIFFISSWVIGELTRFLWRWPVTLLDVSAISIVLWVYFERKIKLPRLAAGFAITLGASWLLSLRIFSIQEAFPGFLYFVRTLAYMLLIIHATTMISLVKRYIVWGLEAFVLLGIVQYLSLPDTRFLLRYGWDEHYYRLIGTVLDPNYAGAMVGMIGIFALDQFLVYGKRLFAILGVTSVIALALTFSRASWLATGIALIFYFISKGLTFRGRSDLYKMAIGISVIASLVFFIAPKPGGEGVNLFRTDSIVQRFESWKRAIFVWKLHPFFGIGFNNYRISTEKYQILLSPKGNNHAANAPDNSWLLLLATLGLSGTSSLVLVIVRNLPVCNTPSVASTGGRCGNLMKTDRHTSLTMTLKLSFFILVGIHSFFNNTLFYPPVLGLLALLIVASSP